MTTLVTGSSGAIGTAVVEKLADEGEEFVGVDIDSADELDDRFIELDVLKRSELTDIIREFDIRNVIHLAAMMKPRTERDPLGAIEVNCIGAGNVFETAIEQNLERVVFAGSDAVYGPSELYSKPITEDTVTPAAHSVAPSTIYRGTKLMTAHLAEHYAGTADLEIVAVRPCAVVSLDRETGGSSWISTVIRQARNGDRPRIPEPPEAELNLVSSRDVANLFYEVTFADHLQHSAYNTGGHRTSAREFGSLLEEITGTTVRYDESKESNGAFAEISHDRARAEFGYELTQLSDVIEQLCRQP